MIQRKVRLGVYAIAVLVLLYFALRLNVLVLTNGSDGDVTVDIVTLGRDHRRPGVIEAGERRILIFYKSEDGQATYIVGGDVKGHRFGPKNCGYVSHFPTIYEVYITNSLEPTIVCRMRA